MSYRLIQKKRGFTLIELLVVIAIIGILSSIVLASLNTARAKGRDARRISDLKSVQTALELYYDGAGNGSYPYVASGGTAAWTSIGSSLTSNNYISVMPPDPTNTGSYQYAYYPGSTDTSGNSVACTGAGACNSYLLVAKTETIPPSAAFTGAWAGQLAAVCTTGAAAPFNYCVRN